MHFTGCRTEWSIIIYTVKKLFYYASLNSVTVENSSIICALNLVNVCGTCYCQDANELPVDIWMYWYLNTNYL